MKIYQAKPRLVFESQKQVYKFFDVCNECKEEVEAINSSILRSEVDPISGYTVKIVEIIQSFDNYYIMKLAKGIEISRCLDKKTFNLAGCWLRIFHELSYNHQNNTVFSFGDFSISNLYVDHVSKEITAIDPGTGFGKNGEIEDDISRFLVSLIQTKSINIVKLNRNIIEFFDGYGVKKIKYSNLEKHIKFRIFRNFQKRKFLENGFKRYISAYFWLLYSLTRYHLIHRNIKKNIINNDC